MKKICFSRKLTACIASVLLAAMLCTILALSVFAEDTAEDFAFTSDSVSDPIFVKKYFEALPRAYEALVNFPEGAYSAASPVIGNYSNNDAKDCFGFEITASGNPAMYFFETSYAPSNNKVWKTKTYVEFDEYSVIGKGWVRIAVSNETDEATGKSVYKLFVNGELAQTVSEYTVNVYEGDTQRDGYTSYLHKIDAVYSQDCIRELSIGSDGKNYFKGSLRALAVYNKAISEAEAASGAVSDLSNENLMAYYDSTMSGNSSGVMKDHTGNGHDASIAFFERQKALSDYEYSFAFVGDTQFLMYRDASQDTTEYTGAIYDWLVKNKDKKNIKYVLGMGDITDRNQDIEWETAVKYHNKLTAAGIPYAVVPGNHDDFTYYTKYNQYFGNVSAFTDSIDGYYRDGRVENYYTNFEVGTNKYTVVALQYGAPDDVLEWANKVVSANKDRQVIVITHALLGYEGQWTEADTREQASTSEKSFNNGVDMWEKFISLHENIIISAAGHIDTNNLKHRTDVGVNGNTVHSFLINPQGLDKATEFKTGMVAMFYFSADGKDVKVEYVSTTKTLAAQASGSSEDILFNEKNQFDITLDLPNGVETAPDYSIATGSAPCYVWAMKPNETTYTYLGSSSTFRKALGRARDALHDVNNGAYKGGKVWIYLAKDLTGIGDSGNYNFGDLFNGELTIDLGGHSLKTTDKNYLLGFYTTNANAYSFTTTLKIMNGKLITRGGVDSSGINNRSIIRFHGESAKYIGTRAVNVDFENVIFESDNANTTPTIILATGGYYSKDQQLKSNILFRDCTFDFSTSTSLNLVKDLATKDADGTDNVDIDLFLEGVNTITVPGADAELFISTSGNNDSAKISSATTLVVPYTDKVPTVSYNTVGGVMHLASVTDSVGNNVKYQLSNVRTEYGYVPVLEAYKKISVFANGYHLGSYDKLYDNSNGKDGGALNRAKVVLAKGGKFNKGEVTVLLNSARGYRSTDAYFPNLSQIDGTLILELNGKTLTQSSRSAFNAVAKGVDNGAYLPETNIVIRNGYVDLSSPLFRLTAPSGGANFTYSGTKGFSFTAENVEFTGTASVLIVESFVPNSEDNNTKFVKLDATFNNCKLDISGKPIFDYTLTGNVSATVAMNSCTVKTDKLMASTILAASEGNAQSLILGKDTVLQLPANAEAPSYNNTFVTDVNDGTKYVFIKSEESNGVATYALEERDLVIFVPKTSITLANSLIYNVYVPTSAAIKMLTLDGVTYTDLKNTATVFTLADGNTYYKLTVKMPSPEAARNVILAATVTIDNSDYSGTCTLSIPQYAQKVIENSEKTEVQLIKDVLSYIRAAYTYYKTDDAEAIAKINAMLGDDYDKNNLPEFNGSAQTPTFGLNHVTFVLNSTPAIRFYVSDISSEYEFFVNGAKLRTKSGSDELGAYYEMDVYAYAMCETVTYTVNGEIGGSYHINNYYNFVTTDEEYKDNKDLINLVERFVKYSESAKAYRNYVLQNQK